VTWLQRYRVDSMHAHAAEALQLQTALAALAADASEKAVQVKVMEPLEGFVDAVSGGRIRLHDTHARRYLAGLKPDITGTARTTALACHVHAPQVELIIEIKTGALDTEAVKGQIARYALEVAAARAVDGPFTVAVMNATHIMFLRVSDDEPSEVWVSQVFAWAAGGADGGCYRLFEYVKECTAHLDVQTQSEWGRKYIIIGHLGTGVSARVFSARRVDATADNSPEDLVVIKTFDPARAAATAAVRDVAPSPDRRRSSRAGPRAAAAAAAAGAAAASASAAAGTAAGGGSPWSADGATSKTFGQTGRGKYHAPLHLPEHFPCSSDGVVCDARAGTELASVEAKWADLAHAAVRRATESESKHRELALVPTVLDAGATFVVFREVGDAIKPQMFYKHHALQVTEQVARVVDLCRLPPCFSAVEPDSETVTAVHDCHRCV
jgi:hypothetical protein